VAGAVLHGGRAGEDDEPTSVVTELVIDSSGGRRRVERARKGSDSGAQQHYRGGGSSADRGASGGSDFQLHSAGGDGLQQQRDSQASKGGSGNAAASQKTAAQLYAEKQAAALARALPRDFDWQTYLLYHPDLRASGITEEQQAKEHYIKQGAFALPSATLASFCCLLLPRTGTLPAQLKGSGCCDKAASRCHITRSIAQP